MRSNSSHAEVGTIRATRSTGWIQFTALALCLAFVSIALLVAIPGQLSPVGGAGAMETLPQMSGRTSSLAGGGSATSTTGASISVGALSSATAIPATFWGVNVPAAQPFSSSDASAVAKTPVTYLRFPGGILGEEFNYTSGILTTQSGSQKKASTTTAGFVTQCKAIHCEAILQLPAEINNTRVAADYASYVVHTLGYQPAYWEIGNDPSGWKHFNVPWNKWSSTGGGNITPLPFAHLVARYIQAVLAVDPGAHFIALGTGMGAKNYGEPWVKALVSVDGHVLSGISVHSYIEGTGPSNPTASELFANLQGKYSLPNQITADRSYILQVCPTCTNVNLFVSEINAAEFNSYVKLLPTFAGTLYLAAETAQGLGLHVSNLDWFAYDSSYQGSWSTSPGKWQKQYYLFSDLLPHLKRDYLPSTLKGPSTFYAAATYDSSGLALFMVNVNTTSSLTVSLSSAGIALGSSVQQYYWTSSTLQPTSSTIALRSSITLPPESIVLLVAPASAVV